MTFHLQFDDVISFSSHLLVFSVSFNREICHRDVKLDNILVCRSDFSRVKLCDFGESRRVGTIVQRRNEWLPYTAPEIITLDTDETYKWAVMRRTKESGFLIIKLHLEFIVFFVGLTLHMIFGNLESFSSSAWQVSLTPSLIWDQFHMLVNYFRISFERRRVSDVD